MKPIEAVAGATFKPIAKQLHAGPERPIPWELDGTLTAATRSARIVMRLTFPAFD